MGRVYRMVQYGGRSGTDESRMVHLSESMSSGNRSQLWVPALLVLGFALLNAGGWWYYQDLDKNLSATYSRRLLETTVLVAAMLDAESMVLSRIWDEPASDSNLQNMVRAARESGPFEDLRLLSNEGSSWFETSDDEDDSELASMLARAAGSAFDSATAGIAQTSELYPSPRGGYFLAACAPVFDAGSSVLGVVVAEAANDYFSPLEQLKEGMILLDLFAGLLFLSMGLIWTGVHRRLARAERAALRAAQLAAMGQMVATVAHELKNPLGIIKNTAERIRTKYGAPDEPLFDFIPEEVDRLDSLLRRYLQFARLEIADTETVELVPFTDKLKDQMQLNSEDKINLTFRIEDGLSVHADPAALRQILLNLILNALEACRLSDGGEVSLFAARKGQTVEIVVSDTGVGMDKETLRRASEPFFTTRPDGSGLGIYLAQTLTEQMNGAMIIRSRAGEGTSVSLTLPVVSAK